MSNNKHENLYLVSDVHSYFDAMLKALEEAGFFEDNNGKLVLLGDALDRGDKPLELIDFLLRMKNEGKLIYITGNHEELLSSMLFDMSNLSFQSKFASYANNGTFDTALSIANSYYDEAKGKHMRYSTDSWLHMDYYSAQLHSTELVQRVRASKYYKELFYSAIDYYETANYIFCHGWIPVYGDPKIKCIYDPDWRDAEHFRWKGARWINGIDAACRDQVTEPKKTIVCGHWHASYGHETYQGNRGIKEPFVDEGIIAIDAGVYHGDTPKTKKVYCVVIKEDGAYYKGKLIHAPEYEQY